MRVEGGDGGSGALADPGTLRRLELLAAAWTAVGAGGFLLAGAPAAALVLTGASALSIVAFRGLQRIVSAVRPEERVEGEEERPGRLGWRPGLAALVRFAVLFGLLFAGALLLDPEYFPAIVLGFSTLPASLITEGLYRAARSIRGRDQHDDVP